MTHKRITSFRGQFDFLSNFYEYPFEWNGILWPTAEHAYQAAKTPHYSEAMKILGARTPGRAKELGRTITLRPNWNEQKLAFMLDILRRKFQYGTLLAVWLLNTGNAHLEEGNTWGDKYWGTVKGEGKNYLGLTLMKIRAELLEREANDPQAIPDQRQATQTEGVGLYIRPRARDNSADNVRLSGTVTGESVQGYP